MSWLPPDEDALPQKKHVSKQQRWERYEEGIWTDALGHPHHLSEMVTPHIINVLEHLWTQANNEGADRFLALVKQVSEQAGKDIPPDDGYFDQFLEDLRTEKIWHEHPFVQLALQELEKRGIDYIRPYDERRLPF